MKRVYFILLVVAFCSCKAQKERKTHPFTIRTYNLDVQQDSLSFHQWRNQHLEHRFQPKVERVYYEDGGYDIYPNYSDSNYYVTAGCMGEWGGRLTFINKKIRDSIFVLNCTCPIQVERRNGEYIVVSTSSHLSGYGSIFKVSDPEALLKVHRDSFQNWWENDGAVWYKSNNIDQTKLTNYKTIFDTDRVTFSIYFERNEKNYLIYSDSNTYLGLLEHGRLRPLDTILNVGTWTYGGKINEIDKGDYHYIYRNHNNDQTYMYKTFGDIYVVNDTIVVTFKKSVELL